VVVIGDCCPVDPVSRSGWRVVDIVGKRDDVVPVVIAVCIAPRMTAHAGCLSGNGVCPVVSFEPAGGYVVKGGIERRHVVTVVAASRVLIVGDCICRNGAQ
jgi:hypothetical protein